MSTELEIGAILADAALAFPTYDRSKLTPALRFYVKALSPFSASVVEAAIGDIIGRSRWFPTVADLVEACQRVEANSRPNQTAAAFHGDLLREKAFELEAQRAAGLFVPDQWEQLARAFDQAGRNEAGNHLRWKAGLPYRKSRGGKAGSLPTGA